MEELYWITRLDSICSYLELTLIFSGIFTIISTIVWILGLISSKDLFISERSRHNNKEWSNIGKKALKVFVPIFLCAFIIKPFVPTTKEAYVIYGVGGTIDHLKSGRTAKQLPHKVIVAIDRYLEEFTTRDDSNKEDKE